MANEATRYRPPFPAGRNERYVGLVEGTIASRGGAGKLLMNATRKALNGDRARGLLSRMALPRRQADTLEAIGVDVW